LDGLRGILGAYSGDYLHYRITGSCLPPILVVLHIALHINENLGAYIKMQYNSSIMTNEKTQIIQVRVNPEEKAGIAEAAELAGISLSSWVRERLRLAAIHELEMAGRRIPFIAPIPLGGSDE
jgi:hypothetical protein